MGKQWSYLFHRFVENQPPQNSGNNLPNFLMEYVRDVEANQLQFCGTRSTLSHFFAGILKVKVQKICGTSTTSDFIFRFIHTVK